MKAAKHSNPSRHARDGASTPMFVTSHPSRTAESLPGLMASVFGKLDSKRRARLLGRLLGSVGPLALAVVGGGAFVKYLPKAGWPVVPVSFEDAALATSSQVYELVRYVEQSNPNLLEGVLTALMQDGVTMTALGASIAAMAIKLISDRNGPVAASPHQDLKKSSAKWRAARASWIARMGSRAHILMLIREHTYPCVDEWALQAGETRAKGCASYLQCRRGTPRRSTSRSKSSRATAV